MNKKHTVAVLFVSVVAFLAQSGSAFAAETNAVSVSETMRFDPLWYITGMIAICMLAAVVIAVVVYRNYKKQQSLLCDNYRCLKNPRAQVGDEDGIDYRSFETPDEFLVKGSAQFDAVNQMIEKVIDEQQPFSTSGMPVKGTHFKSSDAPFEALPAIQLLPTMRHLRTAPKQPQALDTVDEQIEELLRKIS